MEEATRSECAWVACCSQSSSIHHILLEAAECNWIFRPKSSTTATGQATLTLSTCRCGSADSSLIPLYGKASTVRCFCLCLAGHHQRAPPPEGACKGRCTSSKGHLSLMFGQCSRLSVCSWSRWALMQAADASLMRSHARTSKCMILAAAAPAHRALIPMSLSLSQLCMRSICIAHSTPCLLVVPTCPCVPPCQLSMQELPTLFAKSMPFNVCACIVLQVW
jgi:hypothetical protein